MRNYIILNGVNSQTISGLLIQNLPPISKPKQRVEVEEIDGRDGDIVTYLGYGAYDKEFKIGLYGNYDVDEIIAYFNSQGTVIFSNEDDKYYNYQNPNLRLRVEGDEIVVVAEAYAKYVEIYSESEDFILEDNFFDMEKGERRIKIVEGSPCDLHVRSVYDIR